MVDHRSALPDSLNQCFHPLLPVCILHKLVLKKLVDCPADECGHALIAFDGQMLQCAKLIVVEIDVCPMHRQLPAVLYIMMYIGPVV